MTPDNNKRGNNSPEQLVPSFPFQPSRNRIQILYSLPVSIRENWKMYMLQEMMQQTGGRNGQRKTEGNPGSSRRQMGDLTLHSPSSASRNGDPMPLALKTWNTPEKHWRQGYGSIHGQHETQYGTERKCSSSSHCQPLIPSGKWDKASNRRF